MAEKVTGKAVVTRGLGGPKTLDELELLKLRGQAVEWRTQGRTFQWIADQQGISISTAWDRVEQGFQDLLPVEEANTYRAKQIAEWTSLRKMIWHKLLDPELDDKTIVAYLDRLLRIQAQEANLLGLNLPVESKLSISGKLSVETQNDLQAMVVAIEEKAQAAIAVNSTEVSEQEAS